MSDLFRLETLDRNGAEARIALQVVHPDAFGFDLTPGFVLMLLWDASRPGERFRTEIDQHAAHDAAWLRTHARGYVRSVIEVSSQHPRPDDAIYDMAHPYYGDPNRWYRVVFDVTMSDSAWLDHVDSFAWDSAAYEPTRVYDECAPILSESEGGAGGAPQILDGWMAVPTDFFSDAVGHVTGGVLWMPRHGASAYVTDEMVPYSEVRAGRHGDWQWRAIKSDRRDEVGVLGSADLMFHLAPGVSGTMSVVDTDVGLARFEPAGRRLATPLQMSDVATNARPLVAAVSVSDATAEFDVLCMNDDPIDVRSATEALGLLLSCEVNLHDPDWDAATSPLSQKVAALQNDDEVSTQAMKRLAGGFVTSWSVEQAAAAEIIDLAALDADQLVTALRREPWARWAVRVTVTDPAWLDGVASSGRWTHWFAWLPEPEPWSDAPIMS